MLRVAYAVLLALMPLSSALSAQSVCPDRPPPYGLLRQDEDYRYLSKPTCRQDIWDHLKYVPLGSNEHRFITVGGEVREWYEGFRYANWGLGTQDDKGYLLQRLAGMQLDGDLAADCCIDLRIDSEQPIATEVPSKENVRFVSLRGGKSGCGAEIACGRGTSRKGASHWKTSAFKFVCHACPIVNRR